MKTQYTKLCQLRSAAGNLDVDSLAAMLQEAERAHAEYEKATSPHDTEWPTFYAEWMLGLRDDAQPVAQGNADDQPARIVAQDGHGTFVATPAGYEEGTGEFGGYY